MPGFGRNKKMKIGLYSPYLDILGGGERYILTMGQYWGETHQVDVFWDDLLLKEKLSKYLNLDLKRVNFVDNIFRRQNLLKRLIVLRDYDLFIFVTDGSLFFSPAKQNILVIQSPAHCPNLTSSGMRFKFKSWQTVLCYSSFVKKIIDKKLPRPSTVLPPPVDTASFSPEEKKNIILSVGRFFPWLHSKKQEVLIRAFKELWQKGLAGWELCLVGKSEKGAEDYLEKIKKETQGFPIKIITDASFSQLAKIYGQAKIYWHATGFGENLEKHPEKAEHFGITTVEAMAAGCVPVVIKAGAQPEIVQNKSEYLWETLEELGAKTLKIVKDQNLWRRLSLAAQKRSQDFSKERFSQRLDEIIKT